MRDLFSCARTYVCMPLIDMRAHSWAIRLLVLMSIPSIYYIYWWNVNTQLRVMCMYM